MKRRGEKIGWIGGWAGAFLWLALIAILRLVQGRISEGVIDLALLALAITSILMLTPWRFPRTPYWKLLLPPYILFFASIAFWIWSEGGWAKTGMNHYSPIILLPILLPFAIMGRRFWLDGETPPKS
jgi:phosphatidylserine synthase